MTKGKMSKTSVLHREVLMLVLLGLIGILLLPLMIYFVGAEIFGEYAGSGFGDFYRNIHSDLRQAQPVVIFLVVSPYAVWQLLRLSFYAFRRMAPARSTARTGIKPEIR